MKKRLITANTDLYEFQIPVKWEMRTTLKVPANSLKEAIKIINRKDYDLPEGEPVPDSYEIDYDRLEDN